VAGELWAALSIDDTEAIADPFRPSAEAVSLLRARAFQLTARRRRRGLLRRAPRLASI
jgi:hypothetical protein